MIVFLFIFNREQIFLLMLFGLGEASVFQNNLFLKLNAEKKRFFFPGIDDVSFNLAVVWVQLPWN